MRSRYWFWLLLFLALPLLVRVVYSQQVVQAVLADSVGYISYADHLLHGGYFGGGGSPDSVRPPLYPSLLAMASALSGTAPGDRWCYTLLNCLFDAVSMACLAAIARRIGGKISLLGIFLIALSPIWFGCVNNAVTEPCAATMFFLFLERWTRDPLNPRNDLWAAGWLAALTLTRSMYFYLPVFMLAADRFGATRWLPRGKKEWRRAGAFLLLAFLPSTVWGIRNLTLSDQTIQQEGDLVVFSAWLGIKFPRLDFLDPAQRDAYEKLSLAHEFNDAPSRQAKIQTVETMKREVFGFVSAHPLDFLGIILFKVYLNWIGGWWSPFHFAYLPAYFANTVLCTLCLPVLLFGAIGLGLRPPKPQSKKDGASRRRAIAAQLALCVYVTVLTAPFAADSRYSMIAYLGFGPWFVCGIVALIERMMAARSKESA